MIVVERIINNPVSSCCYIVWDNEIGNDCVIIDPASENPTKLLAFLAEKDFRPSYIILTHEHFDHCLSVNMLRKMYPNIRLVCSEECNVAIQDEKKNCSIFWDNQKGFCIKPADIITEQINNHLHWNKTNVRFIPTPGHTKSSVSILIDKYLFTGDAYIPGMKTVTKLPGGNKQQAAESEARITAMVAEGSIIICPGHGHITNKPLSEN